MKYCSLNSLDSFTLKTMAMSSKKCGKRKDLAVTTAAKEAKINTQVASKQPKINKKGATWVRGIEKTR